MSLKEMLRSGEYCVGPFLKAGSPALIEVMGYAGFDFAILDQEHGPFSFEALEHQIMAAELVGLTPVVRIDAITESAVIRPLDKGAPAILVPHVDSAEMAEAVIRFAFFAPEGQRGMDVYARAAKYGHTPKSEYLREANERLTIVLQIEGQRGLENLDEILCVSGVDVIFIGPYDLSQSLGVPGHIDHPEVIRLVQEIANRARSAGRHVGIYADSVEAARKWIGLGMQFIALSVDTAIFYHACAQMARSLREEKGNPV